MCSSTTKDKNITLGRCIKVHTIYISEAHLGNILWPQKRLNWSNLFFLLLFFKKRFKEMTEVYINTNLPRHNQTGGSMWDLEDDASVARTKLTDLLEIVVLQLPHLLLLCQKGLQTFPLLLVQLQLLQLLLQGLQVCSYTERDNKGQADRSASPTICLCEKYLKK